MKRKITQILAIFVFVSPLLFHYFQNGAESDGKYNGFIFGYYVVLAHIFAFILLALVNMDGPKELVKHASYLTYVLAIVVSVCWLIIFGVYGV